MKKIFLTIVFCIMCISNEGNTQETERQELIDYINWFFRNCTKSKKIMKRAAYAKKEIVPIIIEYSKVFEIDPLKVAVTISFESSWTPGIKGGFKEVGLMQVMRGKKGNKKEVFGGIKKLKQGMQTCKNNIQVNSYYLSGSCKKSKRITKKARRRHIAYVRAVKRHRKK